MENNSHWARNISFGVNVVKLNKSILLASIYNIEKITRRTNKTQTLQVTIGSNICKSMKANNNPTQISRKVD